MNALDIAILVVLLMSTFLGAWRGLVREAISALTWVISFVLAWFFAGTVSRLLIKISDEPVLRQLLAFALIFLAVFVLGMVVSWLIHKYIPPKRGFRIANNTLGGLIGAARGAAIVIAIFLVAGLTSFPQRPWWHHSSFAPYFERAAVYVAGYIPRDIARHIRYG